MTIAWISAGCIFGGALLGMALGRFLPAEHLGADSKDAIKLGAGMISLLAALVLGLLVSSAKNNFDASNAAITQGGAKAILLDRVLARYGAEAGEVRGELRRAVAALIEMLWPEERSTASGLDALERTHAGETMLDEIRRLRPQTDAQRELQAQARQLANELLLLRWVEIEQAQTALPTAFLGILLFWLTVLFTSFGLIAPRNATVVTVLFIGALSLATAVFLILEMNEPMSGVIRTSSGPMRKALEHLGE
jgi:hypothetical protein